MFSYSTCLFSYHVSIFTYLGLSLTKRFDFFFLNLSYSRGVWVAHLVECPTLCFGSGHDLMGHEMDPMLASVLSQVSA